MELPTDFDAQNFWEDSDYAAKAYTEPWPSDELIGRVEADLGYRLPAFYVALMRTRNGGVPVNTCFPTTEATGWADDQPSAASRALATTSRIRCAAGWAARRCWTRGATQPSGWWWPTALRPGTTW